MFSLPNPKKTITIEFPIDQVMKSIPKITAASDTKYNVTEVNAIFNQVTLECSEFLSLGVYIDFNLVKKSETSTEVTVEIRRKIGSFDNAVELQNANHHFMDLVNHLSSVIVMSDDEFNKKYSAVLETIANKNNEDAKPWFAKKNVPTLCMILGLLTLPILIGFILLPLGIYARKKNKEYLNNWKIVLLILGLSFSYTASAQWAYEKIDNGLDDPYKIAYTNIDDSQWLKLENYKNEISFYIGGVYVCDEKVSVDISFLVNGVYQKYNIKDCYITESKKTVFFVDNLKTHEMLSSFKNASLVKVRLNDITCGEETYEFKMSGSTAAYNFMSN
jgi:hypothetical protein